MKLSNIYLDNPKFQATSVFTMLHVTFSQDNQFLDAAIIQRHEFYSDHEQHL